MLGELQFNRERTIPPRRILMLGIFNPAKQRVWNTYSSVALV